jgi:hypothetical protein
MLYSMGAMTTYGHQSLFLEDRWRLLGTIEALNGWLLFGLSTAFLFLADPGGIAQQSSRSLELRPNETNGRPFASVIGICTGVAI